MPTKPKRPPARKKPVRRVPKRHGFRRVVAMLLALLATELAWRTGAFAHPRSHLHDRAVSANQGPPLAGSPVATAQEVQSNLDQLISTGYPVMCGGGTKPLVALTFDDGPGPYTQKVVHMLKKQGARATFFIVAKELVGWPQLADEPKDEATIGAIGDHTYDHIGLVGLSQADLDHQIADAKTLIEEHSGVTVQLFRPPYGQYDAAVDHEVQGLGMLEVLWTVDSGDATGSHWETVLQTVQDGLRPGAIILLHENRAPTLRILPQLLQEIRARGLHTVTVPELLAADPPSDEQLKAGTCP
jgi:peptidoglycan/xylan/chitin deacetylase (PgdA/CDA1 family)